MQKFNWHIVWRALILAWLASLGLLTRRVDAAVMLSSFTAHVPRDSAPSHIVLSWRTASEIQTAGFNLYRSANLNGPYTRINPQLIPASNDMVTGGTYQYVDNDIQPGQTYFYQLEDVEFNGKSTRHEPISVMGLETQFGSDGWIGTCLGIGTVLLVLVGLVIARQAR